MGAKKWRRFTPAAKMQNGQKRRDSLVVPPLFVMLEGRLKGANTRTGKGEACFPPHTAGGDNNPPGRHTCDPGEPPPIRDLQPPEVDRLVPDGDDGGGLLSRPLLVLPAPVLRVLARALQLVRQVAVAVVLCWGHCAARGRRKTTIRTLRYSCADGVFVCAYMHMHNGRPCAYIHSLIQYADSKKNRFIHRCMFACRYQSHCTIPKLLLNNSVLKR